MKDRISQTEVLAWLTEHHPDLHAKAELERDWVWLFDLDLRGDHNKPVRESIKEFGFRWAKRGHPLPSGKTGVWGHSCERPTRFKRHGKADGGKASAEEDAALLAALEKA